MEDILPRDAEHQPPEWIRGEMLDLERQKLFNWVYESEPSVIVEIGGGAGGGSTFSIAEAIARRRDEGRCQNSILLSADPRNGPAREFYGGSERYGEFIKFLSFSSDFEHIFLNSEADIIRNLPSPDFLFFDGPEDPELSLKDFKFFDNMVKSGCKFSCHDWEILPRSYDGHTSVKALTLRPYLENLETWETSEYLSGLDGEWPNLDPESRAESVGLIYMVKK